MSRGPIIDTGLLDALGSGRAQGINVFQAVEQARQDELRREDLRRQMADLEAWRTTQAQIDRERIGQDQQELGFRRGEADRKVQADHAAGQFYRGQLGGPGMTTVPMQGGGGISTPMQLPDPLAGAPTEHLKLLTELDARRQSESMGRQQAYAERSARAQRRKAAVRAAGGDDQDVYDNLKATGDEEFADWGDTDFEAAKGQTAELFAASVAPHVQAGRLNPESVDPIIDGLRRGDIDLAKAKDLVSFQMMHQQQPKAEMDPAQFDVAVRNHMTNNPRATRAQAEAFVSGATGYGQGGMRTMTLDSANSNGNINPYDIKRQEVMVKEAEDRRDELRKQLSDFSLIDKAQRKDEYASLSEQYNAAKADVSAARSGLMKLYGSGGGAAPANPAAAPQSANPPVNASVSIGANPSAKEEAKARFRAQNGHDPDPNNPTDVAAMKVIYRSVTGGG